MLAAAALLSLLSATPRHAVVIGSDRGLADEPRLQFAQSDAERVAAAWLELGVVSEQKLTVLVGLPLEAVRERLERALAEVPEDGELFVFVSGHADARGVHVSGEVWPWKALRSSLGASRARRSLAFVDACQSGAVLTAKGISFGAPLKLSAEQSLKGRVLLTSSGANELSYESTRLSGSPFAQAVVTGLRGAADADGDARVTLEELYAFLYARTLAASLAAGTGQHAGIEVALEGSGEWVLSELGTSRVRRGALAGGDCFLLDENDVAVLSELPRDFERSLAVAPGRYRVKCLDGGEVSSAWLSVRAGETAVLAGLTYQRSAPEVALARGAGPPRVHRLALLGGASLLDASFGPAGSLRYAFMRGDLALEARGGGSNRDAFFGLGVGSRLPWLPDPLRLELGLEVSGGLRFPSGWMLLLGQYTQLEFAFERWALLARVDVGGRIPLAPFAQPQTALGLSLGVNLDFPISPPGGSLTVERMKP